MEQADVEQADAEQADAEQADAEQADVERAAVEQAEAASRWKRWRRRLRTIWLEPALRSMRFGFGALTWGGAQRVGRMLGRLAWIVSGRDRSRALAHLAIAFPEMPETERRLLARRTFLHLGTAAAELLHLWGRSPETSLHHVRVEGFEIIEELRRAKRAVFLLTAHCGNWEMLSTANLSHGLGLTAMVRQVEGAAQVAEDLRAHFGSVTLPRGERRAISGMLRVLRSGGALVMLLDQDIETDGVWVPFFGRPAHTPTAGADLALRLGAAVVPVFSERLNDGSHCVRFHPPLSLPDDITEATAVMTAAIEEQVRRRPEQWVWMHKRWRRRPPEEALPREHTEDRVT